MTQFFTLILNPLTSIEIPLQSKFNRKPYLQVGKDNPSFSLKFL